MLKVKQKSEEIKLKYNKTKILVNTSNILNYNDFMINC